MYTLMLVDDEDIILNGLQNVIDWERLGFTVCGAYRNGAEALEAFLDQRCDVVMTDIKMPVMDGIRFLHEIRNHGFDQTEVLIMSGYDEFAYAQNAVRLSAVDYILKPADPDSIEAVFSHLKGKLDKKASQLLAVEKLRRHTIQSLPAVMSQKFSRCLAGQSGPEKPDWQEELLLRHLAGKQMTVCTIGIGNAKDAGTDEGLRPDAYSALLSGIQFRLDAEGAVIAVHGSQDELPLVLLTRTRQEALDLAQSMVDGIRQTTSIPVFSGIGGSCRQLKELSCSYQQSLQALQTAQKEAYGLCGRIIEYIDRHFAQAITLKEISERFHFSPNYIGNLFKRSTGRGMKEYIIEVRLAKADQLIAKGEHKLYEISRMVGYSNYEYFRKLYKKYRGKNPSD